MTPTAAAVTNEVLALIPEATSEEKQLVREISCTILNLDERGRKLIEKQNDTYEGDVGAVRSELLQRRKGIYEELDVNSKQRKSHHAVLKDLRHVSKHLRSIACHTRDTLEEIEAIREAIEFNFAVLQDAVGKENTLPFELRYIAEIDDPAFDNAIVSDFEIQKVVTQDGSVVGFECCGTCGFEFGVTDPRWRCMNCVQDELQCEQCHTYFPIFHEDCDVVLLEHSSAISRREEISSGGQSLASTLFRMFNNWSDRPCFRTHNEEDWITYHEVLNRSLRIASQLVSCRADRVLLCFPAGSMNFYLCDFACALCGITSIGVPVSSLPDTIPEASHAFCEDYLQEEIVQRTNCIVLDVTDACEFEPYHVPLDEKDHDSIYTIYFTSGTTGKSKEIHETRTAFLKDFTSPINVTPIVILSFLPPCWASDRNAVYECLYNGGRVGFSHPEPSLSEIVEDMTRLEPSYAVVPPLVLRFLCATKPPPFLGRRLQFVGCGGAAVSKQTMACFKEIYGTPVTEGYGTTEVGGIAVDGRILPSVRDSLRVRNTVTGQWVDTKSNESVIGELWVGDQNTQDVVEVTDGGRAIRVLGRTDVASAFKMENGKWCSLVEIEDEILQASELVEDAFVMKNNHGMLVLIAFSTASLDESELYAEVVCRSNLSQEMRPKGIILTNEPFEKTVTMKVKRGSMVKKFQDAADNIKIQKSSYSRVRKPLALASGVLGREVDPSLSFFENGGNSVTAVEYMHQLRMYLGEQVMSTSWNSLLSMPLESLQDTHYGDDELGSDELIDTEDRGDILVEDIPSIDSPPQPLDTSRHVLLTGATGFLGRAVLKELLKQDSETIIVCLVTKESLNIIEATRRVIPVTEIPLDVKYKQVIHLAARVNHVLDYQSLKASNVDLTEKLLRFQLAPMLYCSTMSTKEGSPPFSNGYTQSKWVGEQMVAKSGGTCFWPPLLVWGNKRDWLTRLVAHCLRTGMFPFNLGTVVACPVEQAAKDLVEGRECTVMDLDLKELFRFLRLETGMKPIPLGAFVASLARSSCSPAYSILPLLEGQEMIGDSKRSTDRTVLPIDEGTIRGLLHACRIQSKSHL